MGKSFFEFSKNFQDYKKANFEENLENDNQKHFEKAKNFTKETETNQFESVEEIYNKYKNMNRDDLLNSLHTEVAKQKKEGNFNSTELYNAIDAMSFYLTPEQVKNMKEMLKSLE